MDRSSEAPVVGRPLVRYDPALWGIVGPLSFITSWVIAGSLRDGYDIRSDAISRLAEQDAPYRWIVLTGIAIVSFASILMGTLIHRRWRARVAAVTTMIAGVSAVTLGIFVCSPGCPGFGTSLTDTMHSIGAVVHYVSFGLSPLIAAATTRHVTPPGYRWFSLVAGLVGGSFLYSQFTGWGENGITQRVGLTTLDIWMIVTAIVLMRTGSFHPQARRRS